MLHARISTAQIVTVGPILDSSGVAVTTAVVGDLKISKNGGAPAALNGSATLTHRNTGHYSLSLTATDLNTAGTAEVVIDATTNAMPVKELQVMTAAAFDAMYGASAVAPLSPTVAGRTLDVSAGGEAGVDWANVGSPSTAQNLAATTINQCNTVTSVSGLGTNAIPAVAIQAGALTPSKFAHLMTRTATAQAGAASSITLDGSASTTDDLYNGQEVTILSGTGAGQSRKITDYVGATRVATVDSAWAVNPNNTSVFVVTPLTGGSTPPTPAAISAAVWAEAVRTLTANPGLDAAGVRAAVGLASANTDAQFSSIFGIVSLLPSALQVADALLNRNIGNDPGVLDERTVRSALRFNRNRWVLDVGLGTLTVYKEDDTTVAWTAAVTTAAGNPVDSVNPT